VTNLSDVDLHIVVLDLASDGSVCILYPGRSCRARESSDRLASGKALPITIQTALGDGQESTVDIVKVIASTTKIRPQLFEQDPIGTRSGPPEKSGDPRQDFVTDSVLGLGRGLEPVTVAGWVSRERVVRVARGDARLEGFALHFADDDAARGALDGASRARGCMTVGGVCYESAAADDDETTMELRAPAARGDEEQTQSAKDAFDEAYDLMDQTGAVRVAPDLVVEVGADPLPEPLEGARGGGGTVNDPRADNDPGWALAHVRAPEAWELVRSVTGRTAGHEAEGIVVAHPDTGYRAHPEIWSATDSVILAEQGYDYYDRDDDATDELLDERRLDNPAHGTGSASAIVSPMGCQLASATKCPTGPALGAHLVPLRVGRSVVQFTPNELARASATRRAATEPHEGEDRLMSISLGGPPSYGLWKATKKAEERGYLILAAAGNYVRKVVWPARFDTVIAVAATNVGCRPWESTSHGSGVDFSAPGESVWRASLAGDDRETNETSMGTGTTYATATAAGVAALWLARHAGTPELAALKANGTLTETFRSLAQSTAWRPDAADGRDHPTCDPGTVWRPDEMGAGILDAAALLAAPLPPAATPRAVAPERTIQDLPLWSSLYSAVDVPRAIADYRRFSAARGRDSKPPPCSSARSHYYTMDAASPMPSTIVLERGRRRLRRRARSALKPISRTAGHAQMTGAHRRSRSQAARRTGRPGLRRRCDSARRSRAALVRARDRHGCLLLHGRRRSATRVRTDGRRRGEELAGGPALRREAARGSQRQSQGDRRRARPARERDARTGLGAHLLRRTRRAPSRRPARALILVDV
jgi:hypothetical protein